MLMWNVKMLFNDVFSYVIVLFINYKKNWGLYSIVKLNKVRIFKIGLRGLWMIWWCCVDVICGWFYIFCYFLYLFYFGFYSR